MVGDQHDDTACCCRSIWYCKAHTKFVATSATLRVPEDVQQQLWSNVGHSDRKHESVSSTGSSYSG